MSYLMARLGKKRTYYILIIAILLLVSFVLLNTYALWIVKKNQTGRNEIAGACLSITFTETNGSGVSLTNAFPIPDSEGLKTGAYKFTVHNDCEEDVNYQIVLDSLKTEHEGRNLNTELVKLKFDNLDISKFSDLTSLSKDTNLDYYNDLLETRKIINRTVSAGKTNTHSLRIWMSDEATNDDQNMEFSAKVRVVAGQKIIADEYSDIAKCSIPEKTVSECFNVDDNGVLTHYDYRCGFDVSVPDSVDGKNIKTIASDAFYDKEAPFYLLYDSSYSENDIYFALVESFDFADANSTTAANLTEDDLWFVLYNNDNNIAEKGINYLINNPDSIFDSEEKKFNKSGHSIKEDAKYYMACENNPRFNVQWLYKVTEENGEYSATMIGSMNSAEAINSWMSARLVARSLDLSSAVHLEEIADSAFKDLNGTYGNLTFPNSLKAIGSKAFYNYDGSDIIIPASVTTIGNEAFNAMTHKISVYNNSLLEHSNWAPSANVVMAE